MKSGLQADIAGLENYLTGKSTFVERLLPAEALKLSVDQTLAILQQKLGEQTLKHALDPDFTQPSPLENHGDARWMRTTNMVGVNIRTIGHFWNLVNYLFTVPACQQSVHLLPIWEPGVVASLYGMASWHINPEFFCSELAEALPQLNTVERQLKVTVNLLHALGRVVGMDVIPHTDRYSEIVLTNPHFFEWLQRKGALITDHSDQLFQQVQQQIYQYLIQTGPAQPETDLPASAAAFFELPEETRCLLLFGQKSDAIARNNRRGGLIQHLHAQGFEPAPATMGPPYRGLEVDVEDATTAVPDENAWPDYRIINPGPMSRVFGPLTRYQLYEAKNGNRDWEIDFERPKPDVWQYVCNHYAAVQREFHLDFMRGDMSHVQMRPDGVPAEADAHYDIHRAVLHAIRQEKPYFGYFAETFLAPPDSMAYGNEEDHLDLSEADVTLGDLQSAVLGAPDFLQSFRFYLDLLHTREFAPCFTMMTGDKDDPRFDKFYLSGNEARFFMGLFLTDMPSYMGLGFECRDPHPEPAPNEHYTKLYVFRMENGSKATQGPYVFGNNTALLHRLNRIRQQAETWLPALTAPLAWLIPPDATGNRQIMAWTQQGEMTQLFVVNTSLQSTAHSVKIPCPVSTQVRFRVIFSALENEKNYPGTPGFHHGLLELKNVAPGEALIIQIEND